MIYFLIIDLELETNLMKIGYSKQLTKNFFNYIISKQYGSFIPLKCIGITKGDRDKEKAIHRYLRNYNHHGNEIFIYCQEIIEPYLKLHMNNEDIILMNNINKRMKEIWEKTNVFKKNIKRPKKTLENFLKTYLENILLYNLYLEQKKC